MKYQPPVDNLLTAITYGSHLYGTSTPTSDFDFKAVYLPALRDLILAKTPKTYRYRFDAEGNPISDHQSMPANGYEAEHTPIQKFIHDFAGGQAYAVETVFAVVQGAHRLHVPNHFSESRTRFVNFEFLCHYLAKNFIHRNVNGMVGFAMKQTFDYVKRGERLNAARTVLKCLQEVLEFDVKPLAPLSHMRLDTKFIIDGNEMTCLDFVAIKTGCEIGSTVNNERLSRTLKLNGREYLETTTITHLIDAVTKLCDQYGERSANASKTDVDWKSLSHAVRVYQQVIELLETGFITFPRPNAEFLRSVKSGDIDLESVKTLLSTLDSEVEQLVKCSKFPEVDTEFRERLDATLSHWLEEQYALSL